MNILKLNRDSYINLANCIDDTKSSNFAKESLELWDNYYSWKKYPPLCLISQNKALCFLFYSLTRNGEYLIIHRVLTPYEFRKKGYAKELMSYLFYEYAKTDVKRFRMSCVSSSIDFYNKLGLNYWGVNIKGQYYCDFKIPKKDILEIPSIVKESSVDEFSIKRLNIIQEKLKLNGSAFNKENEIIHNRCLDLMGKRYRYNEILNF